MVKGKNKLLRPLNLLLIACLVALSFIGIGYSYWNDSLGIFAKIITAKFEPMFCEQNIQFDKEDGLLEVEFKGENNSILEIKGNIKKEDIEKEQYINVLNLCIKNNSSFPINLTEPPDKINNGIDYQLTLLSGVIPPGESIQGNPKLTITIPKEVGPGDYPFKFDLIFKQWNEVGWEKTFTIRGNITILEPKKEEKATSIPLKVKTSVIDDSLISNNSVEELDASTEYRSGEDINKGTGTTAGIDTDGNSSIGSDSRDTSSDTSSGASDTSGTDGSSDTSDDSGTDINSDTSSESSTDASSDWGSDSSGSKGEGTDQ